MKSLPVTPATMKVAQRVVWFKPPEEALADPIHFLAHLMTFGTIEDLIALQGIVGKDELCEVLDHAPPGIFDARSWAYWNLKCGRQPAPPLPKREERFALNTATYSK
jgi:hypothetical protein